jgi:hypothetical protein
MNHLTSSRLTDFASQSRKIILPGEPEPEWLRRNVELARVLPALKADMRARKRNAHAADRRGILARLRMALTRA